MKVLDLPLPFRKDALGNRLCNVMNQLAMEFQHTRHMHIIKFAYNPLACKHGCWVALLPCTIFSYSAQVDKKDFGDCGNLLTLSPLVFKASHYLGTY